MIEKQQSGLYSLKWSAGIILILGWNLLMLCAINLNGGFGKFENIKSKFLVGIALLGILLFTTLTKHNRWFQNVVIEPSRKHLYNTRDFTTIQIIVGVMLIMMILDIASYFLK
jgi:hypothetical protein